ncbi:MAG: cytidine deaminase [Christensenellales bacterium]
MKYKQLIERAKEAMDKAYAPYSRFRVGAALLCGSGRIFSGANIENASYGVTCCAERVALFKAVSEGETEFDAIAVVSGSKMPTYPCGVCRQALFEFSPKMKVIAAAEENYQITTLDALLPCAFSGKDMEN